MKKTLLPAGMAVLLLIGLTSMVSTPPPENNNCKEMCTYLVEEGHFSDQGDCMSICNVCFNPSHNRAQAAVCECKLLENTGSLEDLGFKNFGDCVTTLKK